MKRIFFSTLSLILLLGIPTVLGVLVGISTLPLRETEVVKIINIPPGTCLNKLSSLLCSEGIIRSKHIFSLLVRLKKADIKIKAGEYQFSNRMFPAEILSKLIRGEQVKYTVIIPEGLSITQIANLYEKVGLANKDKFIRLANDPQFVASLGMEGNTLEGYLFPDTYRFTRYIGEKNIIRCMVQRFKKVYGEEFKKREQELNLSQKEVIIIASLIEKETSCPQERPIISAVFHNRLRLNMPLQCDPTVIFGLNNFNGNLTKEDLKTPTPYNTYLISGLPPTPIANPGLASIKAALYPADVDYLYFVSKNDGTHYFSSTLKEHNQAVYTYQKKWDLGKDKLNNGEK